MRTCSPSEFITRWPGSLHSIALPEPPPALPADCRKLLTEFGLPHELTIYCYNDITLKFSESATPLAAIWDRDLERGYQLGEMPEDWARFGHLADQEYQQGGGWLCVEEGTGRLVIIDLDQADPIYLLNSNLYNFYTTLAHFLEWSETTDGSREEIIRLRDTLRSQDCVPLEELEPFWMEFIDATLDFDQARIVLSLNPQNA
ncbi:MAG TPA: SUKH-4 family immunity protein [Pirellulaceae bacterium]|nr:SUKH-4 family immunity protein [Pirellulaceae bacterium]